jgi:hypothetical protein
VTIRQLTQRKFLQDRFGGREQQTVAVQDQPLEEAGNECAPRWQTAQLPTRPDDTVLSDSIPLFFIGRNQNGFWVARESAGRCGGLFLFRWSAARFARKTPQPALVRQCSSSIRSNLIFPIRAAGSLS